MDMLSLANELLEQKPLYQNPLRGISPFHVCRGLTAPFGFHWHGEIEIIYVFSGQVDVMADNTLWHLEARDAICISSAAVHAILRTTRENDALVMEMGFPLLGADFSALSEGFFAEPLIRFSEESDSLGNPLVKKELEEIFLALSGEPVCQIPSTEQHPGDAWMASRFRVCAYLYRIAGLLTENIRMVEAPPQKERQAQGMRAVQCVLNFVREAYDQPITVERAAAMAGYEKTRFCQLFKWAVGVPFHRYLTAFRLDIACSMLRDGSRSVSEIGDAVGIHHAKTFCRLFRSAYGMTPTEYREGEKGGEKPM
ncbi:MAG: helix-turn-helix domain-containing protein [Eubacteriales bacterium]